MKYTDQELEEIAAKYENGITPEHLENAQYQPGPYAWLIPLIDDWDAFSKRLQAEQTTPENLVKNAVNSYLQPA